MAREEVPDEVWIARAEPDGPLAVVALRAADPVVAMVGVCRIRRGQRAVVDDGLHQRAAAAVTIDGVEDMLARVIVASRYGRACGLCRARLGRGVMRGVAEHLELRVS